MNVVAKQMELIVPLVQRLDALVCDGRRPADVALAQLWREHREWGARDRRFFGDAVFAFFRWRGWLNYFSYGTLWKTYGRVERFLQTRVRRWLVQKHRVGSRGECRYPARYLYEAMGLINPCMMLSLLRKP